MSSVPSYQTIMFADLVGSTSLYEAHGDVAARRIVADCLAVAKQATTYHRGEILAELGDEVMASFNDPGDAAAAACDIHAKMQETLEDRKSTGTGPLRMRIGMHYGPVLGRDASMASDTAKIAHWAANNAKPEQTLATSALIDVLPRIFQAVSRYVDDETWNFISIEHMAIHEIIWDVESVTAYSGEIPTLSSQRCAGFRFTYRDKSVTVDANRPVIAIGRGSNNDLIVSHDLASRQHVSAQFSRGRCTVTDNSTNGTVVYAAPEITGHPLRRDSITILGHGTILLGQPGELGEEDVVRYESI
ncbi:MAG: adenylate/guanylate cyclase domain-containing protein [Proteobacteria bacterium]|nr:adenylate/guanylate cyclase domain-containing protein [Pseudomonadota bacterium]